MNALFNIAKCAPCTMYGVHVQYTDVLTVRKYVYSSDNIYAGYSRVGICLYLFTCHSMFVSFHIHKMQ